MSFYQIFSKIYQRAAEKMCSDCQDFIGKGCRILDLGSGAGLVGQTFKNFFQAEVTGIDIKDINIASIPFKVYDGQHFPFSDSSFDAVLVNFVLHHSESPKVLLTESKRVAKDKIIIYEDLSDGFFSKLFCKFHGFSFDSLFGNPWKTSFRSEKEWENLFRETGLSVIFKKRVNNFPVKKQIFVLGA